MEGRPVLKNHIRLLLASFLLGMALLTGVTATGKPPLASLTGQLQPLVDRHSLAGAVLLVSSKDRVLDLETVGYADIAAKKPMRTDNLFWIASMNKPITATALMMLVDEGKVNVEDPVEKYLPEFKGQWLKAEQDEGHILLKRPRHPITIRNLLTHTSGSAGSRSVGGKAPDL